MAKTLEPAIADAWMVVDYLLGVPKQSTVSKIKDLRAKR
jgi:hypothetical protein